MKALLLTALYASMLAIVLLFKNKEVIVTGLLAILYGLLCSMHTRIAIITSIIIGTLMPIAEYICIKRDIWVYKHAKYTIPTWLPFGWAIVALFTIDVYRRLES